MGRPIGSKNIPVELHPDEIVSRETFTFQVNPGSPVKTAFLHQAITWPGVSGAEKTISATKIKGVEIYWAPQGLVLQCKGQTCIVPHANVANAILL